MGGVTAPQLCIGAALRSPRRQTGLGFIAGKQSGAGEAAVYKPGASRFGETQAGDELADGVDEGVLLAAESLRSRVLVRTA